MLEVPAPFLSTRMQCSADGLTYGMHPSSALTCFSGADLHVQNWDITSLSQATHALHG